MNSIRNAAHRRADCHITDLLRKLTQKQHFIHLKRISRSGCRVVCKAMRDNVKIALVGE